MSLTLRKIFNRLPAPANQYAIENVMNYGYDVDEELDENMSISEAIKDFIDWNDIPEGYDGDYWENLYDEYYNNVDDCNNDIESEQDENNYEIF